MRTKPKNSKRQVGFVVFACLIFVLLYGVWFFKNQKPHVVLIMVDTLRADYLGAYGFQGPVSPHLDKIAEESVVFTRAVAPSPYTKPSIASLFTGVYPNEHGLTNFIQNENRKRRPKSQILSSDFVTLAEVFKEEGYQTAGFFSNRWISEDLGFHQGFDEGHVIWRNQIHKQAKEWLEKVNTRKPFFLYLHFMDVHGPYTCLDEDYSAIKNSPSLGEDRPLTDDEKSRIHLYCLETKFSRHSSGPDSLKSWRGCYGAGVRYFDRQLNKIIEQLKELGVYDNSVLVFTSDHGEEFLEKGKWNHGTSHSAYQTWVPLIIRFPQAKYQGRKIDDFVSLVDIFPTLVDYLQFSPKKKIQWNGESLLGLLKRKSLATRDLFIHTVSQSPFYVSVIQPPYKIEWPSPKMYPALYDILGDFFEKKNISGEKPSRVEELKSVAQSYLERTRKAEELGTGSADVTKKEIEALKSLGYLQ